MKLPGQTFLCFFFTGALGISAVPARAQSFTVGVSASSLGIPAGSSGSITVTVTPNNGFAGSVALACSSGVAIPAGYECTFQSSTLTVAAGVPQSTSLTLQPAPITTAVVVKTAHREASRGAPRGGALAAAAFLLVGFVGIGTRRSKGSRNFVLGCGLILGGLSAMNACGGGGGGGGGPVTTTTTISSSDLRVGLGTGVTFTVTVRPNGGVTPTGLVQLFDNGQALGGPNPATGGIASFVETTLPVGVHTITANYLGDANTQASTSAPISQEILGTVAMQVTGTSGSTTETANFNVTLQ